MASDAAGMGSTDAPAARPSAGSLLDTLMPGGVLELPDDVQFQLDQFKYLVSELQAALDAASQQVPGPAEYAAIPEPLERARLCLSLAKAVNALHHVYLRAHGRDPFAPPPSGGASVGRQELDRVRQYDKKVGRAVHDAEVRASRPVLSLDVAAASRFIDAAIPDLSAEQRGALKRAAQAVEAKRGTNKKSRGGARGKEQQPEQGDAQRNAAAEDAEGGLGGDKGEEGTAVSGGGSSTGRRKERSAAKGGRGKRGADEGGMGAQAAAERFLASLAAAEAGAGQERGQA